MTTATGTLSPKAQQELQGYRDEIDALDRQLIALLNQRIEVVSNVGRLKRQDASLQCFIRSGREADMLRNIYQIFEDSPFSPQAACSIWRQIISASTQYEEPMQLLLASHGYDELTRYATSYFGDFMPIRRVATFADVAEQLQQWPSSLFILPEPKYAPELWEDFAAKAPQELHLFAQIPFVRHARDPIIYVAAQLMPEPGSQDSSLFAVQNETGWHFHAMAGFQQNMPEDILASFGEVKKVRWLGAYGVPIEVEENEYVPSPTEK